MKGGIIGIRRIIEGKSLLWVMMMCVVALLLLTQSSYVQCKEEKTTTGGSSGGGSRFEKLIKDYSTTKQLPIKFDTSKLKTHASNIHNYSLILFFTSDEPQVKCQVCK